MIQQAHLDPLSLQTQPASGHLGKAIPSGPSMGEPAAYRWIKPTAVAANTTSWQPAADGLPKSASPGLWGLQPCGAGACPGPKRECPGAWPTQPPTNP